MELRVDAVELYGRVRGANRSRVLKCSDGSFYVVKNQCGSDGKRGLVNELLASLLLRQIGISTPEPAVVNCSREFLEQFPLWKEHGKLPTQDGNIHDESIWNVGLCFGSRVDLAGWDCLEHRHSLSYLPEPWLKEISNLKEFVDVLVFDAWCGNVDHRQAVFIRPRTSNRFRVSFIDHGQCFAGRKWNLALSQRRCAIYGQNTVYDSVFGLDAFEDIMLRIADRCSIATLRQLAAEIPAQWYEGYEKPFEILLCDLSARRKILLPFLIDAICSQRPSPFKNWSSNWRLHPQNAFLPDSFEKISVPTLPLRKTKNVA